MSWNLNLKVICLNNDEDGMNSHIHRFRNLAEEIYRQMVRTGLAEISLYEIDRITETLRLSNIKARKVNTLKKLLMSLAKNAFPDEQIVMTLDQKE